MREPPEISREVLEEGCYYLSELGLSSRDIASKLEISEAEVLRHRASYTRRVGSGKAQPDDFDLSFWRDVKKEAEGNVKLTFLSEKGFHHAWKTDLQKMDGPTLMAIYEECKAFLDTDPNQRFLDFPAPKGYDPLALQREVKRSVGVISSILDDKWAEEKSRASPSGTTNRQSGSKL